jgi:hypothetical protein
MLLICFCGLAWCVPITAPSVSAEEPVNLTGDKSSPDVAFVFTINVNSTKESQEYPFQDRLVFNYSPDPGLRFVEGTQFSDEALRLNTKTILSSEGMQKIESKRWLNRSARVWVNAPSSTVMEEAAAAGVNTLCYLHLKSCALVQQINQGKTLFKFNRDKPDKTTAYDYFYNLVGEVGLIDVKKKQIFFQRTLGGLDYDAPKQKNSEHLDELLNKTMESLGDLLSGVLNDHKAEIQGERP